MHLVGFIIRNLTRCTVTWTSKLLVTSPHLTSPHLTLCVPITYRRCRWCRSVKPCSGSSLLTTCDDSADDTHSHKDGVNQRLLPPTRHSMILRGCLSQVTNYNPMVQGPYWEANRFSASQEIPHILRKPKVHYHVYRCPSPVPILSQLYPLHTPTSHFQDIHFNPLNPELNPIYLLALLGAHHFLHVSRIRVKLLTFRLLMSYIYGAPILDVSRSHATTQHSR